MIPQLRELLSAAVVYPLLLAELLLLFVDPIIVPHRKQGHDDAVRVNVALVLALEEKLQPYDSPKKPMMMPWPKKNLGGCM